MAVDVNKLVTSMINYLCKPELEMTKGLSKMVEKLINLGHYTGLGSKGVLKNYVKSNWITDYFETGVLSPYTRNSYGIMFASIHKIKFEKQF